MADIEENEGAVGESSRLMDRDGSAGEVWLEMERITTAHNTDVSTTNTVAGHNFESTEVAAGTASPPLNQQECTMEEFRKSSLDLALKMKQKMESESEPKTSYQKWSRDKKLSWICSIESFLNADYKDVAWDKIMRLVVLLKGTLFGSDPDLCTFLDLLMNCQEIKVNMPIEKGYTAIGLAARYGCKECLEHMLTHQSPHRLYLDYYPGDKEFTVREIIMETYPELQSLLPAPLMESLDSTVTDINLLAALQRDKYEVFCKYLDPNNPNPWYDEPYHSYLLEIACQMKNREQFVKHLLDRGANPNIKNRITGMPLLHATARSGNFEVLEILLQKEVTDISIKDSEKRTIVHWLAGVRGRVPGDKQKIKDCLEHLLGHDYKPKLPFDDQDCSGNTALCCAVEHLFKDRVLFLLKHGADVMSLEQGSKVLLPSTLSILEEILDDCLGSNNEPATSEDYVLYFKDPELLWNLSRRMAESQHLRKLLRHPVITNFVTLKWQRAKNYFFVDFTFCVIFVLFLTAYLLHHDSYNALNDRGVAINTTDAFSFSDSYIRSSFDTNMLRLANDIYRLALWTGLNSLSLFQCFWQLYQLFKSPRHYIHTPENLLQVVLIIATFIHGFGFALGAVTQLHISAVALFLGWLEVFLMLRLVPQLSIKLEMLRTVSWTFLQFMAYYVILLIAFALSFYIFFKGNSELANAKMFANPLLSLLKTIVMFTGEFDASNLPFDNMPYTSHVIFLLFVVLVTIILLNLLNGLAVGDTDAIRKNAETLSLVARVTLISKTEALQELPPTVSRLMNLSDELCMFYPNRSNAVGSTQFLSLLSIINKKKQPNKERESSVSDEMFTDKFCAQV